MRVNIEYLGFFGDRVKPFDAEVIMWGQTVSWFGESGNGANYQVPGVVVQADDGQIVTVPLCGVATVRVIADRPDQAATLPPEKETQDTSVGHHRF